MKIGVTPKLVNNPDYFEVQESWDINWSAFVKALGFEPVLLTMVYDKQFLAELNLDGVIFSGGNDLSIINSNQLSLMRDTFEKNIFDFCFKKAIPMLGICRGQQFIASQFNDIPVEIKHHVAVRHELNITNDCSFYSILKNIKEVNSYHNYGFYSINKEWEILAKSSDQSIECIYQKNNKILCHMWHPERESPFDKNHLALIKAFFEENN